MGPEDMPVQTTPSDHSTMTEVDPGDVTLSPENEIYEEIYQRVLQEVRARIDQRIADIEAQASAAEPVEGGDVAVVGGEHADAPHTTRRTPLLRIAITLAASAGLVGAVVTLARDHREAMTSVTDRIDAALQAVRESLPKASESVGESVTKAASMTRPGKPDDTLNSADVSPPAPDAPPSAAPTAAETTPARPNDPSSAMAEAPPDRDLPSPGDRELAPLIEKIAHDVAELQTGLQDLKASQQQASRDQTKAIEQLQAGQDQLTRAVRAAKTEAPGGIAPARIIPRAPQGRPPRFQ